MEVREIGRNEMLVGGGNLIGDAERGEGRAHEPRLVLQRGSDRK